MPVITGLLFSLSLPPFNHELHWIFSLFPFFSFFALIPLLGFSIQRSFRRSLLHIYLFSFSAALGQYYWIAFVTAEGLWHLIIIGLVLVSAVIGIFYLVAGISFRFVYRRFSRFYIFLFPAIWVLIDYIRTLGDISFPWAFLGYNFAPVLPLAQSASVTGVWGLTFLVLLGNMLLWELITAYHQGSNQLQKWIHLAVFTILLSFLAITGTSRMGKQLTGPPARISLIQSNIDQLNWGNHSLDTAFSVTEALLYKAANEKPDIILGPESALLCYLARRPELSNRVLGWADSIKIPFLLGAIHWDNAPQGSHYDYMVYNTAFLVDPDERILKPYYKIKLVPFSEAIPFEAKFPILSRINLGEADFQKGKEQTVFSINNTVEAAPFICYEIIYPGFVRNRLKKGANLIAAITNDGWFGKSSGPFQHESMARMRAIENGVPMARCANSGISLITDQYGRVLGRTGLYKRTVLTGSVTLSNLNTPYSKYGDWFVALCALICITGSIGLLIRYSLRSRTKQNTSVPPRKEIVSAHSR